MTSQKDVLEVGARNNHQKEYAKTEFSLTFHGKKLSTYSRRHETNPALLGTKVLLFALRQIFSIVCSFRGIPVKMRKVVKT